MMVEPAPSGWNPESTLKPSTQGILSTVSKTALIRTLFFLDHPYRSMPKAMIFSNTAMTVVSAAKLKNTKNMAPQSLPPAICAKIFGMVMKIRRGPESGWMP